MKIDSQQPFNWDLINKHNLIEKESKNQEGEVKNLKPQNQEDIYDLDLELKEPNEELPPMDSPNRSPTCIKCRTMNVSSNDCGTCKFQGC